jgi:metal-responsive CopG/Arc/MetJ family transcriptional regulator
MSVQVSLPDDLAEQIDHVAADRTTFVAEAVRRLLRESATEVGLDDEVARINEVADELNREAEDVLEYQVIS